MEGWTCVNPGCCMQGSSLHYVLEKFWAVLVGMGGIGAFMPCLEECKLGPSFRKAPRQCLVRSSAHIPCDACLPLLGTTQRNGHTVLRGETGGRVLASPFVSGGQLEASWPTQVKCWRNRGQIWKANSRLWPLDLIFLVPVTGIRAKGGGRPLWCPRQ